MIAVLATPAVFAGEIPGLPPSLPPYLERDFELTFSNDFLGRGGSVDDFRTQQIIVAAKLSDRWLAVADHSILTLHDDNMGGRIDQLSASLGYKLNQSIVAGIGIRSAGEFAGERIQNGFHRLIGSELERLPYTDESATRLTAWVDANHH